jgi:F0F1-type ATP synthase assembly protein I
VPRERSGNGQNGQRKRPPAGSADTIAFTLLAGIVVGLLAGYGLDRVLGTLPVCTLLGVFAGFAAGLYAVFMQTK